MGNIRSSKIKGLVEGDALLQDYDLNDSILSEGVLDQYESNNDLLVEQNSPLGLKVKVNKGVALVKVERISDDKRWLLIIDNQNELEIDIASNSSGSDRVDALIIRIDRTKINNGSGEPDANDVSNIEIVTGTGATALTDGAIQTAIGTDFFYRLANITVEDSETQIQDSDIDDTRSPVAIGTLGAFLINAFFNTVNAEKVSTDLIQEKTADNGVSIDGVKQKDGFTELSEISSPATPAANKMRLYVKEVGGDTHLFTKDQAGTELDLTLQLTSVVTISGNVTQALVDLCCSGGDASEAHIHPRKVGTLNTSVSGASGTINIAHGLGTTPTWAKLNVAGPSSQQALGALNSVSLGKKVAGVTSTLYFGHTDNAIGQAVRGIDSNYIIHLEFENASSVNGTILAGVAFTTTEIQISWIGTNITGSYVIDISWECGVQ